MSLLSASSAGLAAGCGGVDIAVVLASLLRANGQLLNELELLGTGVLVQVLSEAFVIFWSHVSAVKLRGSAASGALSFSPEETFFQTASKICVSRLRILARFHLRQTDRFRMFCCASVVKMIDRDSIFILTQNKTALTFSK